MTKSNNKNFNDNIRNKIMKQINNFDNNNNSLSVTFLIKCNQTCV